MFPGKQTKQTNAYVPMGWNVPDAERCQARPVQPIHSTLERGKKKGKKGKRRNARAQLVLISHHRPTDRQTSSAADFHQSPPWRRRSPDGRRGRARLPRALALELLDHGAHAPHGGRVPGAAQLVAAAEIALAPEVCGAAP